MQHNTAAHIDPTRPEVGLHKSFSQFKKITTNTYVSVTCTMQQNITRQVKPNSQVAAILHLYLLIVFISYFLIFLFVCFLLLVSLTDGKTLTRVCWRKNAEKMKKNWKKMETSDSMPFS